MDLRRLQCFFALAEELNFRRAAERCHISQPGLSQMLRQLEDQLEVRLFHRDKRNVSLTPAGELFRADADRLVRQMREAVDRVRQVDRGAMGELRIGATATALFIILPEILEEFSRAFPKVVLNVESMTTADQERALRRGDIQLGVVHPPLEDPGLACLPISSIPFDVAMSTRNPLAARRTLALRDLARENFILFPRAVGPRLYDDIITLCHHEGFSPGRIIEAAPAQSIVSLAACNMGVGFVASRVQHYERALVTYRRLQGVSPMLSLGVVQQTESAAPIVQTFIEIAQRVGRKLR